jgi:PAS domain S-box-containing protein
MTRDRTKNFWNAAAQFFLGSIALALVTWAFFKLGVDLAPTAFAYLIVILLCSLIGSFIASALLAIISIAGLAYFFAPPIFSLRIDDPQHITVVVAFLLTSLIVTRLMQYARERTQAALEAEANLRRSEADLRDSEKEWREVFEHNPLMHFKVDATGTVMSVNTFGAAQLGYSAAELAGQSVLNVFLEDDREFVRKYIAVCLETIGQPYTWEIRKVRKNGSVLWVRENAKAMRQADGKPILLIACEDITERKQAESALQQSEAYLAEAQELSRTGSFGWSVATGEIVWSKETFRIFQCDPAMKPTLDFIVLCIHPEDRAAMQETIDQASRTGMDFDHEYRLLMPDDSVKYIHAVARAARGASGGAEFRGAVTDVTGAKESERKLRRSEAYLAEAQRLSRAGSWALDARTQKFVYRSAEAYRLFGVDSKESPASPTFHERIFPEDLNRIVETQDRAIREKTHVEVDFRIALPDGSTRRVHSVGHPVLDSDGNVVEVIGTHIDVTEQYAAKEALQKAIHALRESEERFRDYAETASDWLWETGPDLRVTRMSEHVDRYGITSSSLTSLAAWEFATDVETEPEKWRRHREMIDARLPFRDFVFSAASGTGSAIYIKTSGKPFFDADGNFLGYRGTGSDITATIRADHAEQALRKAQTELAHITRVTTLGELTASIAHETNQPLAAVVANAEACLRWLNRATPDLDGVRRSVKWIIEDGHRATEVVRRVKALAKKTDIEKAPLDINEAIREVIALLKRELTSHQVSLQTELAPALPTILGDRVQLQQVIINLVMNGIEAMQPVTDRPHELLIRSHQAETNQMLVSVTDCGVGISAENADRLFNAFFTTKSSGLGMGLSICRSIVEAHGGRLSACANEGAGATFQFVLPLQEEAC